MDHPAVLDKGIQKLHYPIGYKLGGDGPEALALGIMAQINAIMYGQAAPQEFAHNDGLNLADSSDTDADILPSTV